MSPRFRSGGLSLQRQLQRYTCPTCTARLHLSGLRHQSSSVESSTTNPPSPPAAGYAPLPSRALLSVTGSDAPKFLHGLVTSSVSAPTQFAPGFYTGFLTAQGRVLHDVFVYPFMSSGEDAGYIVEVDAGSRADLLKHLKRHKLRSKVTLRALEHGEMTPYALWRANDRWTAHNLAGGDAPRSTPGVLELVDGRAPGLGRRVLLAAGADTSPLFEGLEASSPEQYAVRRYLRGVPEGQNEIPRDGSFPMNVNLDLMGAIDFRKGCYVGQELTIRTHHTGVVRRRVLPVMLYGSGDSPPESIAYDPSWTGVQHKLDTELKIDGKRGKPGKWMAGVGNIGLAMCRLEMTTDLSVTNEPSPFDPSDRFVIEAAEGTQIGIRPFVSDWLRGKIRAPKVQKRVE
ncbi:hypothetical protein ANO11243_069690 [Dothideomycetidae sp. 11243]|nr:hypothetical protein ANO11243_069690 [fungal sp. No.11243]